MTKTLFGFLPLLLVIALPSVVLSQERKQTALESLPSETPAEYWDRAYSLPPNFNTAPNEFLINVMKGISPGRGLDIGMGQGRNAVYLAKLGWEVTGFDISEHGMELARKSAAAAGVKITTINSTLENFDYGVGQWDLIVGTYVGINWLEAAVKSLKPGGFLVIEGYAHHPQAPPSSSFKPNELLKLCIDQKLHILRYEDVKAEPDWLKLDGVVRIFARK